VPKWSQTRPKENKKKPKGIQNEPKNDQKEQRKNQQGPKGSKRATKMHPKVGLSARVDFGSEKGGAGKLFGAIFR
jgi:hypothetical protein